MDWTERQRRYQLWSALPLHLRPDDIQSVEEFAQAIDVDEGTLLTWENAVGWWDEVYTQAKSIIGRNLHGIMGALSVKAALGNVPAAKLCLSILDLKANLAENNKDLLADQLVIVLQTNVNTTQAPALEAPLVIDMPEIVLAKEVEKES